MHNNIKIDERELYKLYMEWVTMVSEEFDWKTQFTPREIVNAIVELLEKNPQLIKEKV